MWLNALQMTIVPLVVVAADHRHRRIRRSGAGKPARRPGADPVHRPALDLGDRRRAAHAALPRSVPAPGRIRRGAAQRAGRHRAGRRRAELRRFRQLDRPDQPGRRRLDQRDPAADPVRPRLRLRDDPPARRAAREAGRLLPGDRRHDADRDRLGAVDRTRGRVRARLCGRRPRRRDGVRRAAPLCRHRHRRRHGALARRLAARLLRRPHLAAALHPGDRGEPGARFLDPDLARLPARDAARDGQARRAGRRLRRGAADGGRRLPRHRPGDEPRGGDLYRLLVRRAR